MNAFRFFLVLGFFFRTLIKYDNSIIYTYTQMHWIFNTLFTFLFSIFAELICVFYRQPLFFILSWSHVCVYSLFVYNSLLFATNRRRRFLHIQCVRECVFFFSLS